MGSVSVLLVRPLAAATGEAGRDALRSAGISPELLADGDGRISELHLLAAWARVLHEVGEPRLALRIAAETPAGAFGIAEHVCRAAPTFGEALRQWVRYLNLLDDTVVLDLEVEEDRAVVGQEGQRAEAAPAADELRLGLIARLARELPAAPVRPLAVDFMHGGTEDAAPYRAWFEAPVAFGAGATRLVLPRDALAARLPPADPAPLAIVARTEGELAAGATGDPPVVQQVKRALPDAMRSDDAQVEAVAKRLGLAVRSLQRRLKDEGASFQAVREEVRRALAERYLDEGLSIPEISFLLGLSEPGALARAYRRWTGMTVAEHRARRGAEPAQPPPA